MTESGTPVALIHGAANGIGEALALELARRGVLPCLADDESRRARLDEIAAGLQANGVRAVALEARPSWQDDPAAPAHDAVAALGRMDYLACLFVPSKSTTPEDLWRYPPRLLALLDGAAGFLTSSPGKGSAVTHCSLPAMYAGTPLDASFPMVKGAVTGVTRTACRRHAPRGLVVNCVQTGLVDIPETRIFASEKVKAVKVPLGRWGTAGDVAHLMTFLLLKKGYSTGQCIVLDGGLTSGLTGT